MNDTNDLMMSMMARAKSNMTKPPAETPKVNEGVKDDHSKKPETKPAVKTGESTVSAGTVKLNEADDKGDKKDGKCGGKCDGKCGGKCKTDGIKEAEEPPTGSAGDVTGNHAGDVNPTGSAGDKTAPSAEDTGEAEEPDEVMIAQEGENAFYVHLEGNDAQAKIVITDADDKPLFTSEPVSDLAGKFQELIKGADTLKIPQISVVGLKALGLDDLLQALKQAAEPQGELPPSEDEVPEETEDEGDEGAEPEEDDVPRESKKAGKKVAAKKFGGDGKGGFKAAKKNEGVVPDFSKDDPETVLKKLIEQRNILNRRIAFCQRLVERARPARRPMSLKEWADKRQALIEAKKKEKMAKAKQFGGDGKGGFKKTGGK
jgi:hypothetical protein